MFAHSLCGDGNFSERKRQVFQLPVPSWETAECSKDLILWLVLAPFLWEKYYTRKEVTCEYNILVDILYVRKDEDSWTQVESDIQILALPGKEMRWYLHILFRRLREWCRYGIKKDTAESTQLYLFFLIVPKNHTTLKRWPHSAWTKSSFTTIKNYTTLKPQI